MLTQTFVEKTFFDIGGLALDEESSTENSWQLYAYQMPKLTASLQVQAGGGDSFKAIAFEFNNREAQKMIRAAYLNETDGQSDPIEVVSREKLENLCVLVRQLIDSLPTDFDVDESQSFDPALDKEDTEAEAMVKERRGQNKYRKALEKLWDSQCAVTGVSIPEVLRASHAKPWKDCETGKERIDPYNGFLLNANLDALFDKFLISFSDDGKILISPKIGKTDLTKLGINVDMKLRRLDPRHIPYLSYHRSVFEEQMKNWNIQQSLLSNRKS